MIQIFILFIFLIFKDKLFSTVSVGINIILQMKQILNLKLLFKNIKI